MARQKVKQMDNETIELEVPVEVPVETPVEAPVLTSTEQAIAILREKAAAAAADLQVKQAAAAAAAAAATERAAVATQERESRKQLAESNKVLKAAEGEAKKNAREAAKAVTELGKQAKADERAAAKALREAEKASKDANKVQRADRIKQNGVTMPVATSICGQAWAIFNAVSSALQAPAPFSACTELAISAGINPATLKTQYALWRKFYGVRNVAVASGSIPTA
mgnify:CR=1 FL=1